MPSEKKEPEAKTSVKSVPTKEQEPAMRLSTLLSQEKVPEIQAKGFLAGLALSSSDRMTRSEFRRKLRSWLGQLTGKDAK